MEGFDLGTASAVYVGDQPCSAVYLGSEKVWGGEIDYSKEYLTFEIVEDGTITIKASNANIAKIISYSTDEGNTWTDLTTSTTEQSLGSFSAGDTIMLKGTNTAYGTSSYNNQFGGTAKYNAYGNIMSLLYGDDFDGQTTFPSGSTYTFKYLFNNSTGVINASNLILPATTLADSCYRAMFSDCTSLTQAPSLPVTILASNCYSGMFYNCSSLTTAPELPATTLAEGCYDGMFNGCTSLNYIKAMFTTIPPYPWYWVSGVSATGTFVKNSAATWNVTGQSGVPTGWTVETADA